MKNIIEESTATGAVNPNQSLDNILNQLEEDESKNIPSISSFE
jgi:hypothetical protein